MPMSLTKAKLVKKISSDTGYTQKRSSEILTAILDIFAAALAKGDRISIRGFGKFYSIKQREKKIRHPSTGQLILSRQKRIVRFKHFKYLHEQINSFEYEFEEFKRLNKKILQQLFNLIENSSDYEEENIE